MDIEKTKSWIQSCLNQDPLQHASLIDKKQSTEEFLKDLKCLFQHYLKAFEELKSQGFSGEAKESSISSLVKEKTKHSIFMYDLSEAKGFMLFKQNFKLLFSSICPGQIRIQFLKQKLFSDRECLADNLLHLVYKDMMSVNWVHENKKGFVDKDILVRYYMKRFLEER